VHPGSGKTDNRARQRLPEDKSPSVDQVASLRFAGESRGRVCLLVVESTRRSYWRGPNGRFPNSFWVFHVRIPLSQVPGGRLFRPLERSAPTHLSIEYETQKNRTFFIGPASFRLWLCVVVTPTHNVTHASRIGTGHFILTKIFRQSYKRRQLSFTLAHHTRSKVRGLRTNREHGFQSFPKVPRELCRRVRYSVSVRKIGRTAVDNFTQRGSSDENRQLQKVCLSFIVSVRRRNGAVDPTLVSPSAVFYCPLQLHQQRDSRGAPIITVAPGLERQSVRNRARRKLRQRNNLQAK
jgi:hypothetical protein